MRHARGTSGTPSRGHYVAAARSASWTASWVPVVGGRRIPPRFVLTVACVGATLLTVIVASTAYQLISLTARGISNPNTQVDGWHHTFLLVHYVPAVLWPVGLWVAIAGYALRHRSGAVRRAQPPTG